MRIEGIYITCDEIPENMCQKADEIEEDIRKVLSKHGQESGIDIDWQT